MPPPMQNFRGGPGNNLANHYQGYPSHTQGHNPGLPPPGANPGFMNANSMSSAFAVNGNSLGMGGGFGNAGLGMPGGTGLASQAAQMSFAGASPQQLVLHNGMADGRPNANKGRIREVWKNNLHEEMATLRQLVDKYPYVAMDTEFPGVVARPMGGFSGKSDYHYQCVRVNVDMLKLIQIGITLFNEDGETPPASTQEAGIEQSARGRGARLDTLPHTWQFNFQFSLAEDMSSLPSIESLQQAGVDFAGHERDGIDHLEFASLLITSGLVCDDDVKWISFHGGYDFAYTTKLLRCLPLPEDEQTFDKDIKKFFPTIYDIKYLMKEASRRRATGQLSPDPSTTEVLQRFEQKGGLEGLAESLKIKRQGTAHNAGSDSLLTGRVFFRIREKVFNGEISPDLVGQVWGLMGVDHRQPSGVLATPRQNNQQLQQENSTPNQNGYTNGAPSTPNTGNARPAGTPNNATNRGIQPMTPGGGGGAFGEFTFAR